MNCRTSIGSGKPDRNFFMLIAQTSSSDRCRSAAGATLQAAGLEEAEFQAAPESDDAE